MCCASDNHNYMCHTWAKEFSKFEQLLTKYHNCPKFHIFTNIVIFQVYLQLLRPTTSSLKFYDGDMSGILFLIFAICKLLIL